MSVMWCWICMLFSLLLVNMQSITVSGETCQAKTLLASELHYLAQQCREEMHARIASNFIELVSQHLGTIEGGDGNEKGVIESVQVECGERSITLRRRDIVDSEQSSKVPLTLKFAVKVPLPSNTSVIDLNQTTKKISSDLGDSLNETDLTLNISGVVLEYDESNPPVVRVVGLFCEKGQILQGTNCVSCPPGYFLDMDSSGCQACAVDQYQHQETQTSCFPCPSGTSTLGQRASKRPEDCRDNTPPSFNNTCPGNMVFYTGNCSSYRTLRRWKEPMATDNSGHVSISYPAIRPPVNLSIGLYNVLYSAIDSSGNRANCTFVVKVARKSCPVLQPPVHGSIASFSCGPAFGSLASLTCDTGYQLAGSSLRSCKADGTWSGNETTCNINCARGSYYNKTGCQACAVDQYQDQEAQTFCLPCPPGTSTLGQLASKSSTDCHEKRKPASSNQIPMISGTVTGTLTFITLIIVVVVRKRYLRNKRMTSTPVTPIAYAPVPDDTSTRIQIKDEGNQDSHTNYSNETPYHHLPTSSPKYITKQEGTFTSTGGELSAPLDSNVRIIVPKGAIPAGVNQPVFFGVFFEEAPLLQNILEASDKTLISPVVECGPHDISLKKPVEIIVPHCLCLGEAKKEWIIVYRCGSFSAKIEGRLIWERVPNESMKNSKSPFWFKVEKDSIRIKTKTFSLWSIFACGGPRRKRATVFASKPDPRSDLIYLRFYVYSDNEDSKKRVELKDKERFPDSKPAREEPFRMYNDNSAIMVKLTDLEKGWEFDKTDDTQIYRYERASGNRFRSKKACDFAVKPEDGRDVNGFSCMVKFQQEEDDKEYSIYLNPGFTPLKRQRILEKPAAGGGSVPPSSNTYAIAGCSTGTGPEEEVEEEKNASHNQEEKLSPDSSREKGYVQFDPDFFTSLGLGDDKPVTESLLFDISPYVGVKWKPVLRKLSTEEVIIRNLDEDNKNASVDEKCYQGLLAWRDTQGSQGATIKTLCHALCLVGCSEALKALKRNAGR